MTTKAKNAAFKSW